MEAKRHKIINVLNYRDHSLSDNYIGFPECHIQPDWLLVYTKDNDKLILTASHTGTHADIFGK